jgi:hypothetical protein
VDNLLNYKQSLIAAMTDNITLSTAVLKHLLDSPDPSKTGILQAARTLIDYSTNGEIHQLLVQNKTLWDAVFPFETNRGAKWIVNGDREYIIIRIEPFIVSLVELSTGIAGPKLRVNDVFRIRKDEFQKLIDTTPIPDITAWSQSSS